MQRTLNPIATPPTAAEIMEPWFTPAEVKRWLSDRTRTQLEDLAVLCGRAYPGDLATLRETLEEEHQAKPIIRLLKFLSLVR